MCGEAARVHQDPTSIPRTDAIRETASDMIATGVHAARRGSSDYDRRHVHARPDDFPEAHRVQSDRDRDRERDRRDRERERLERDRRRSRSSGYDSRDRDRPRLARHITPVDGVGGRKYVSPVWGNRWEAPKEKVKDV
jgi:hypothetical protein